MDWLSGITVIVAYALGLAHGFTQDYRSPKWYTYVGWLGLIGMTIGNIFE